jgi:putative acetyltransferase
MILRRYDVADRDAVRRIHAEAFRQEAGVLPPEVGLLDALLDAGDVIPALSLVALADGEPVGHVLCSRATVGTTPVAGLGPIGVLPARQGRGTGAALLHAVLGAADALELPLVGLLGSPELYGRFGFVPAASLGVEPPDPAWGGFFQVRALSAYDPSVTGAFRYAAAFEAV